VNQQAASGSSLLLQHPRQCQRLFYCLPMGRPALPVVLDTLAHLVIEGLAGGDIHHLQPRGTGQLFGKAALAGAGTAQNQFDQSVTPYAAANHGPPLWAEKGSREPRSFPQASKEAS